MSYAVQSRPADTAERDRAHFLADLRHVMHAVTQELAGAWRCAVARREFNRLDANTLRDLGMSRCEFDSYWAESHGTAEQTRVRVIQGFSRRCGL